MTHPVHTFRRGEIHHARAEAVYPDMAPGSVALVISDGPYGMGKAGWDQQRTDDDLRAWYRPHVEAWGRACAKSATVYIWGTDDSASALRPLMREHGWTKRVRITWDKRQSMAIRHPHVRPWADVTEVCDIWERGAPWHTKDRDNPTNVWVCPMTGFAAEKFRGARMKHGGNSSYTALHPCQKPLEFYDRIIRASSRPGDLVLEPFGGTCRAAFAIEALPDADARRYVCIEPDEDGRDYLGAVTARLRRERIAAQPDATAGMLFGEAM